MLKFRRLRLFLYELSSIIFPIGTWGDNLRGNIMRPLFKKCGHTLRIKKGVYFLHPESVSIGDLVYISNYCSFGAGEIEVGDQVLFGPGISLMATNHTIKNNSYRFGKTTNKKIKIGNGSWIGTNACLLAGVTIGKGSLVAAGAVVTKNVDDFVVVGGVPAKYIKDAELISDE